MPDSNGNYVGDWAGVLPDNTPAVLSLNSQFLQLDAQRRAEKERQKKEEEGRQVALQKYVGDALSPDKFDPSMQADTKTALTTMEQAIAKKQPLPDLYALANKLASDLQFKQNKITKLGKVVASQVAAAKANDPYIDTNAVGLAALKLGMEGGDADENQDYISPVIKDLRDKGILYSPQATEKAKEDLFKNPKYFSINEPATYKPDGSLEMPGVKGKYDPRFGNVQRDEKGNIVYKNGKAVYDIYSENYRIPGTDYDYLENGKPVKVIPDVLYDKLFNGNPAAVVDVEKKVRGDLGKDYTPDSERANFLRKKYAYEWLKENMPSMSQLEPQKDESFARRMQVDRLKLAKAAQAETKRMHNFAMSKYNTQQQEKNAGVRDIVGEYIQNNAISFDPTNFENPFAETENSVKVIPDSEIDEGDKVLISNDGDVDPITVDGKRYWVVNKEGNLVGDDNQVVQRSAVQERLSNKNKEATKKVLPVGSREQKGTLRTYVDKIKSAFTPKKKEEPKKEVKKEKIDW